MYHSLPLKAHQYPTCYAYPTVINFFQILYLKLKYNFINVIVQAQ